MALSASGRCCGLDDRRPPPGPPVTPETETDVTRVAPMPAAILEVIRELPESGTPMTREAKDNLVRTIAGLIDIYYPPDPEADS
jgi:hypothetical protein